MLYPDEQLNVPTESRANSRSSVGATTSGQVGGNDRNPRSGLRMCLPNSSGKIINISRWQRNFGRLQWKKNMESQDIPGVHFKEGFEASSGYITICSVNVGSMFFKRWFMLVTFERPNHGELADVQGM